MRLTRLPNAALQPFGFELRRLPSRTWDSLAPRVQHYRQLVELVEDVPGDVVQCGVGSGISLFMLSALTDGSKHRRHVWGFDSFEACRTRVPRTKRRDLRAG